MFASEDDNSTDPLQMLPIEYLRKRHYKQTAMSTLRSVRAHYERESKLHMRPLCIYVVNEQTTGTLYYEGFITLSLGQNESPVTSCYEVSGGKRVRLI